MSTVTTTVSATIDGNGTGSEPAATAAGAGSPAPLCCESSIAQMISPCEQVQQLVRKRLRFWNFHGTF